MINDVEKAIREYLPNILHMSLATSRDNKPWICEVHFAYDDELNLYFRSLSTRRHSEDIQINNRVAGNMVTQHSISDKPRGVYFEGTAEQLENVDEKHAAYKCFKERFNANTDILEEAKQKDGRKFYKITVENFYLFDARESKPSQKYHLSWNSK